MRRRTAPPGALAFNGFAPDFVYLAVPVPDITIGQAVRLGVAHAHRALSMRIGAG